MELLSFEKPYVTLLNSAKRAYRGPICDRISTVALTDQPPSADCNLPIPTRYYDGQYQDDYTAYFFVLCFYNPFCLYLPSASKLALLPLWTKLLTGNRQR